MADPVTASIAQAALSGVGNFIKNDLIDRIFGSFFGGGGSDLPPLTPEQQAALEVGNALNMAQGDLYGDGQNEGFLEIVGPTFEEAVRKVQALDDSEEKTDLLSVLANNAPYDFTDLTPASITGIDSSDYNSDVLSNPLLVNPLLVEQAVNTGPFVEDDNPNQKAIDAFINLISGKYKKDKKDITPIGVAGAGAGAGADTGANAGAGAGADNGVGANGDTGASGAAGGGVGGAAAGTGGAAAGGSGGSGVDDTGGDGNKDISVISGGSVLDQTDTADVTVDDQPKGFLTGMTPQAQAIINEGNRSDITATMLGPFIAKQDVPIIPPLKFELKNVPQSDFAKALLTSDGLMRSFV